jgi:membrane-bound metal-dependent hydrolase YbcI (DUF457 family)
MFAVGHLSLGYLFAKGSAKLLKKEINLPLVFVLSLIPDIDILIPMVQHRTITHSIITCTVAFLPFLLIYGTKSIPYFVALAQHSLVGDFIAGGTQGTQLLWPLTSAPYGLPLSIFSTANLALEWGSFMAALAVMLKTKDIQKLLKRKPSHMALFLPISTVLLPSFLHFPIYVPLILIAPHLAYLLLFSLSVLTTLAPSTKDTTEQRAHPPSN